MHQKPLRVVIGAGPYNNNPDWIQTQAGQLNLLNRGDWERSFGPSSISAILAEHVWEHLSYEQGLRAAEICFDFLEPGGYVRCAVPDGFFPDEAYQRDAQVGGPGPQDHPAASHQFVFDYHSIATMLQTAGFTVSLLEYCPSSPVESPVAAQPFRRGSARERLPLHNSEGDKRGHEPSDALLAKRPQPASPW